MPHHTQILRQRRDSPICTIVIVGSEIAVTGVCLWHLFRIIDFNDVVRNWTILDPRLLSLRFGLAPFVGSLPGIWAVHLLRPAAGRDGG
jgi:hypothetical protein